MRTLSINEIGVIKMATNPPKEIVDSGFRVIHNKRVCCYVGIGWVVEKEEADKEDYLNIPEVV